ISGCAEATFAPRFRRTCSAALGRTPLECNATLPFQFLSENSRAACTTIESGTQNQTRSASKTARVGIEASEPTSRASFFADAYDLLPCRAQIGVAEGLGPDGPSASYDRKRNAGEMLLLGRMRGPRIEEGKRLRDTACHCSD